MLAGERRRATHTLNMADIRWRCGYTISSGSRADKGEQQCAAPGKPSTAVQSCTGGGNLHMLKGLILHDTLRVGTSFLSVMISLKSRWPSEEEEGEFLKLMPSLSIMSAKWVAAFGFTSLGHSSWLGL